MAPGVATLAVAALVGACAAPQTVPTVDGEGRSADGSATVTRVVDGDTVHVLLEGADVTIRLIGIDTPETVAPDQPVECFGSEASDYTTERLEGQEIGVRFDVERTDPFGRTLAYVFLDDELFNETLVRRGYALVTTFPPNVRYVERFTAAQREARADGAGLWGACEG